MDGNILTRHYFTHANPHSKTKGNTHGDTKNTCVRMVNERTEENRSHNLEKYFQQKHNWWLLAKILNVNPSAF
jgi:hypothetical protein